MALTLLAGWLPPALARSPEPPTITDLMGTSAIAPTSLPQTPATPASCRCRSVFGPRNNPQWP
ncbi:MAG: hypothetical protein WBA86_03245 [Nodosilinea sp.]